MRKYAVSVKECAKRLRRDTVTIYIAISEGRLKAYKTRNRWQIPLSEVNKFIGKTQIKKKEVKKDGKHKTRTN
jgi:excisionase family DNA binding protein